MRRVFVPLAALFLGCSTRHTESTGSATQPIINGTKDSSHEAVVFVYGSQGKTSGAACSGTIVKTDPTSKIGWVLTAAHCVDDVPPLVVLQGSNISASQTLTYSVLDYLPHPNYAGNTNSDYDVAVIRIVGVDATTPVIGLPSSSDGLSAGSSVTSVGFGRTETSTDQNPNEDRKYVNKSLNSVTSTHIGYSLSGSGICQGDSGGPVLFKSNNVERVVGVHSYVSGGCTGEGSGTGYSVRVQSQLTWINSRLALAAPAASCDLCEKAANSGNGKCAALFRTCEQNKDCKALYDCVVACGSSSTCRDACNTKYPKAVGPFLTAAYCPCNQACATECSSTCGGVPKCGRSFGKNVSCNVCLDGACCKQGLDCASDGECYACWNSKDADGACAKNAKRQALLSCESAQCQSYCNLDGGPPPEGDASTPPEEPPPEEPPAAEDPGVTTTTTTTSGCSTSHTPASTPLVALFSIGTIMMMMRRRRRAPAI